MLDMQNRRKAAGYTQTEIAEACGVRQVAVSKWENGTTNPNIATLKKLAEIYGCTVDELIREDEQDEGTGA